jgi:hypothetical protein
MLIEVREIHDPKPGGKVARIVAADGERYEIWPDKLAGVVAGKRYDVEIAERSFNERTIKSIKKITPVKDAEPANGKVGNILSQASPSSGEAEYVGRIIAALIIKGEIGVNQVSVYTIRLREVWRQFNHRSPAPKQPGDCNDR